MLDNRFEKWADETTAYLTDLDKWKDSVSIFLSDMTTLTHVIYKVAIPFSLAVILWLIFLTILVVKKRK